MPVGSRAAATVLAALALAAAAGCGGGGDHARRDAVDAYLARVDRAQASLAARRPELDRALRAFSLERSTPEELRDLRAAQALLSATTRRVEAIEPPPDGRRLHADLVRLLRRQTETTDELVQTAAFLPRFQGAIAKLTPATRRLTKDLSAAHGVDALAAAFVSYRTSLAAIRAQLGALDAPPMLEPVVEADRASIARGVAACRRAERALHGGDEAGTNAAIAALFAGSSARAVRDAQAAQERATRAYTARVAEIAKLASALEQERLDLVAELG